jgi:uncharacterized protein YpmB
MKNLFFLVIFFVVLPFSIYAQTCNESLYSEYLNEGENYFKQKNYLAAVNSYSSALAICPKNAEVIKGKLRDVFVEVNKLKENAQIAEKNTKDALAAVERQKKIANENLAKANKLIDAFYFYEGRFTLAFKNKKFYFIDKNGNRVEKLGQWDTAEQFEQYDGNGFAKVQKNQQDFLLDTMGNFYQVAYKIEDLNPKMKALDLTGVQLYSFPTEIFKYKQLEVLILNGTRYRENNFETHLNKINQLQNLKILQLAGLNLGLLPSQIGGLTNLTHLGLSGNKLTTLPTSISELKSLKILELNGNQLTSLPIVISELKNLRSLGLNGNQLTDLSADIGKLINLTNLGLNSNQLISLPLEISELKNLTELDLGNNQLKDVQSIGNLKTLTHLSLKNNQLTSLPTSISKLKKLKYIYLSVNLIEWQEQEKIQKALPNCEIEF